MKINILICTFNQGIERCSAILLPQNSNISYKISHQVTENKYKQIPSNLIERNDVEISQIHSVGVSKNRNNVLAMADGDICFIADDDVVYDITNINLACQYFYDNPKVDILVGKIETYEGELEYKNYPDKSKRLCIFDVGSVSSIEIVFRRNTIINSGVLFDERFGLGGKLYPKGEEAIFLSDCLKRGINIEYFPQYIVKHPKESSASSVAYDRKETEYMGALSARIFKKKAILAGFAFSIKHYNRYKNFFSPVQYLKYFRKGIGSLKN